MKATLIRAAPDEGLEAVVEVNGKQFECMDCLGYSKISLNPGDTFEASFCWLAPLDDEETWESVFSGNPNHLKELVSTGGWSYRAFGEIISVAPPLVDCGLVLPSPIHTHDERVIGEFIAFDIARLDVWQS